MQINKFPTDVTLVEVGPRDGLQNEKSIIDTNVKIEFIKKLSDAGIKKMEISSFVKAQTIPQMSDADILVPKVLSLNSHAQFMCLVPNLKGLEKAIEYKVKEIAVFSATSNTFNLKNINVDVDGSFERINPVIKEAQKNGMKVRAYISTAYGCPYEGNITTAQLMNVVNKFLALNVDEVSIGDTTGVATPKQVNESLPTLIGAIGLDRLAMHFHDTRAMALSNILVSLEHGIKIFDSSSGGLGGCPYAKGATGNVATEDVLYLCESMGIKTGIDLEKLSQASQFILQHLGRQTESKYLRAYLNSKK